MTNSVTKEQVVARAIKDVEFRQALLSNPKAALEKAYNIHLPNILTIRVLEDTPTTLTIVLPPKEIQVQELSDSELEAIAGGRSPVTMNHTYCTCKWEECQ